MKPLFFLFDLAILFAKVAIFFVLLPLSLLIFLLPRERLIFLPSSLGGKRAAGNRHPGVRQAPGERRKT